MGENCLLAYTVSGLGLGWIFYRFPTFRDAARVQVWCMVLVILGAAGTLLALDRSLDPQQIAAGHLQQGYLFLCASLIYLPTVVYIIVSHWNRLVLNLTSPGSREANRFPSTRKEEHELIRQHTAALRLDPVQPHHRLRLADSYLRLGNVHMAIGEYLRVIECLERGYEQAHVLFKTARLIIDQRGDLPAAMPLLRRIIRMYPRSYFASYARRMVNHYDAHHGDLAL